MIHTVYSNSYEVLQTVLLHNIEALRFAGPVDAAASGEALFEKAFEHVPVIVPNRAVEEDLRNAIARRDRVCAGMDFMTLSAWMGFFSKEPLANVVGNEADWMIWQILSEVGPESFREAPGHERLRDYLKDKTASEIYTLSRHIAAVFVVYASYRFDWVLDWLNLHPELLPKGPERDAEAARLQKHPDYLWQRDLWRALAERPHWHGRQFVNDFPKTLARLAESAGASSLDLGDGREVPLPSALHIFVPFVVPPLMLPILKAYAHSERDVWLYLLNPTSEYWFDLVPQRLFDWRRREGDSTDVGHPILADNGLSTRANIDRLWRFTAAPDTGLEISEVESAAAEVPVLETQPRQRESYAAFIRQYAGRPQDLRVDMEVDSQSYYLEAREPALLRRVQDSILNLTPDLLSDGRGAPLFSDEDGSLIFMRAPTATRELEALADWLQDAFRRDPTLRPDDVLVVTPDISSAAPLIDKVFGSLPAGRRIAWRFTGLRRLDTDPVIEALIGLVKLLNGRAGREDFEAWVSLPTVAERFGLSSDDLSVLSAWLYSSGYRFGLSDAHLVSLDPVTYAEVKETTLARAVERLTLGYMFAEGERRPWFDTAPIRGSEDEGWVSAADRPALLEALTEIAALLEVFRLRAEGEAEPARWTAWLTDAAAAFFVPESGTVDFSQVRTTASAVREEIERSGKDGHCPTLSFELFMTALAERLEEQPGGGKPTNAVTFSGMSQLRGLPFRIIAVIGLNADCAFPGVTRREEFDLLAAAPRRGDRDSRVDNRNVFLDLLLSARSRFLVSYLCGTGTDAAEQQPSIVAQELRDWLLSFARGRTERCRAEAVLTKSVPLNPFSADNFRAADRGWQSVDAEMLKAVREAESCGYRAPEPVFADDGLDVFAGRTSVSFAEMKAFWKRTASWILRTAEIVLPAEASEMKLGMIPAAKGLPSWQRRHEALSAMLEGGTAASVREVWLADPRFGAKGIRDAYIEKDLGLADEIAQLAAEKRAELTPLPDEELTLDLGPGYPVVTHRLTGLGVKSDGTRILQRVTVSKVKSGGAAGFALEAIFLTAVGANASLSVIGCEKQKGDEETAVEAVFTPLGRPETARAVLASFWNLMVSVSRCAARGTDNDGTEDWETDERAESILWRGRDLAAARKRRADAAQTLLSYAKAKSDDAAQTAMETLMTIFDEEAQQ